MLDWLSHWWWTIDRYILASIAVIAALGVMLIMAASPNIAERMNYSSFHFVSRQLFFLALASIIIFTFSVMPIVFLRRIAAIGFAVSVIMLVAVLFVGDEVKGATRWLNLGGFKLQPSEFTKPFFIVTTAWILARRNMEEGFPGFKIAIAMYSLVVGLIILEPNFGMTVIISLVFAAQMFLAGLPMVWVFAAVVTGIAGVLSAYMFFPHVAQRINTFLDPSSGDNYQVDKSLQAFVNGGFFGRGPGEGVIKGNVPDAHTDFIFAVAGEELGLIVCILMVLIFAFVVIRGFYRVAKESNLFLIYAASGLLIQFGLQAIVNMGVTLSLLPNTGITLPFVSYGGSSTIAISISMGMILAFTRRRYGTIVPVAGMKN